LSVGRYVVTGGLGASGDITPVGSVAEKVQGAIRQRMNTIILPMEAKQELQDQLNNLPIKVLFVRDILDLLRVTMQGERGGPSAGGLHW